MHRLYQSHKIYFTLIFALNASIYIKMTTLSPIRLHLFAVNNNRSKTYHQENSLENAIKFNKGLSGQPLTVGALCRQKVTTRS